MKRILLLASILGATVLTGTTFGYNVYRTIPGIDDASVAEPASPQSAGVPGAAVPYSDSSAYSVGSFEEPVEPQKLFSGSIVGSWSDGFLHSGNTWNMDQVWLTSEKSVNTAKTGGVGYGYRVDALFGTNILQSSDGFDGKWGVSDDGYGASIYQAYGQIGWGKLSLKAGKFGTTIGIESVDASANNFATHSWMFKHEPATHTGGLFTLQATDTFNIDFGMISGIDNSFDNRRGDTGFLFGAGLQLAENVTISYASELTQIHSELGENRLGCSYGYYDLAGEMIGDSDEYLQTFTATVGLSDKLNYSFASNYGAMSDRATHTSRYQQFGVANYLSYALTEQLTASCRYEYYQQWLEQAAVSGGNGDSKQAIHDVSFSLLYKPIESLFILPEARYDWIETGDFKNHSTVSTDGFTGAVACGFVF